MLSTTSLIGDVAISGDEVVMTYGTGDEEPLKASKGAVMPRKVDTKTGAMEAAPTDREKAEWCSDERPFYALDDKIREACVEAAGEALGKHIQENA